MTKRYKCILIILVKKFIVCVQAARLPTPTATYNKANVNFIFGILYSHHINKTRGMIASRATRAPPHHTTLTGRLVHKHPSNVLTLERFVIRFIQISHA